MAASNTVFRIAELDFDTIKGNLRDYLRSQNQFTDYDFEGSGLNILLDVLAYNTHFRMKWFIIVGHIDKISQLSNYCLITNACRDIICCRMSREI